MDRGHLIERSRRAVIVDHHVVQQTDRGATSADGSQLATKIFNNRFHSGTSLFDYIFLAHDFAPKSFKFTAESRSCFEVNASCRLADAKLMVCVTVSQLSFQANPRADAWFPSYNSFDVSRTAHVENHNRQVVIHAQRDCRSVHHF